MRRMLLAVCLVGLVTGGSALGAGRFPKRFLWGTAISGFQSDMGLGAPSDEGTDWWVWVRDPANVAGGRVSGELPEQGPGFWTRYAEDATLVRRQLRGNAFRMGIEWSRIFPMSTVTDTLRGEYLLDHLSVVQEVAATGAADVRGHFHWSLTDNFEWSSGYSPKFGAFSYDPATGERRLRRGARVLRDVARGNRITRKIAKRYGG